MYKIFPTILFILIAFQLKAQTEIKPEIQKDTILVKDLVLVKVRGRLPQAKMLLLHTHSDSVKYIANDVKFEKIQTPLQNVENVGLRYAIQYLEHDYDTISYTQDSVQQAVRVLLSYAKNDSIRRMVNYLKNYIDYRQTDAALQLVQDKINLDSIVSYQQDSILTEEDIDDISWKNEALKTLYDYIERDSVNQWLREVGRDSIHIGVKNFVDDSLGMWINNGKNKFRRFWLKKSHRDSIGIWVQNTPNRSIRLLVDDDVYQESVQKIRQKGKTKVRLEKKILDEDYKLMSIAKKQRMRKKWKAGSIMGLGFNQGHVSENWAEGGESSVAALSTVNMFANYKKGNVQWDNTLDLRYGLLKTGENGFRKNEDKLEVNTKFGQKVINKWFGSFMFNMKTQLLKGYEYADDDKSLVSNFMSPAYFLLSFGMDYKPKEGFSLLISPATGKWTYVKDTTEIDQTEYGIDVDNHTKREVGAYIKALYKWKISEDISLDNKFQLYSSYTNKPKNIDIDWQLNLTLRVNHYINTNILTHLISDDDTGSKVQFKENITVGISYRF